LVGYSVLHHLVSVERLGHGFRTHGQTGNLGCAITPVYMSAFIYLDNWRTAAVASSVLVGIVLFMTWLGRDMLAGRNQDQVSGGQGDEATEASGKVDATYLFRQS